MSIKKLGETLRDLRKKKGLPLRKAAAQLDIDVAILSKMERGQRKLTRDMVVKMAGLYQHDLEPLMIQFLSEKVLYEIGDEPLVVEALKAAKVHVLNARQPPGSKEEVILKMADYLKTDKRVLAAWVFGSFARGEMNYKSDIDIMVQFDRQLPLTFFDLSDIMEELEKITNRKIDLVEEGQIKSFAIKSAEKDMIKIYEKNA
ncbi:MAG TPA: nucleotidyltransferase domain-containing protein [Saprospiraceae bacterium]|nr:nucleotidyltransferase domain-containing protein [Saprospiraceae bacterium]